MTSFIQANDKIQQLNRECSSFKILNAMLNFDDAQYEGFLQTKQVVIDHILDCENLEELSQLYDDCFLLPMRARGGTPRSSATERVQNQENSDSDSSSLKSNAFKAKVRERDGNRCVLTGEVDTSAHTKTKRSFQVAHFIPQSLLDEKKDSEDRKAAKINVRGFILQLCSWLPPDFFENLDVCQNAILLNSDAHNYFGAFDWFVTMETGIDGENIYKAMQVEENGLLGEKYTGRSVMQEFMSRDGVWMNIPITVSSYNQPLFIGDSHPQPGLIYVKLHEMLARISKMRGQAGYYEIDSDDEYEPVDSSDLIDKLSKHQQDSTKTLVINM